MQNNLAQRSWRVKHKIRSAYDRTFQIGFCDNHRTAERGKIHADEPADRPENRHHVQQTAETTRNRIQTVYTDPEVGQIVFLDTPGIHQAKNKLGEYMVKAAEHTIADVDVVLWLVEPDERAGGGDRHIAQQLCQVKQPVILVINKVDMVDREKILPIIDALPGTVRFRRGGAHFR